MLHHEAEMQMTNKRHSDTVIEAGALLRDTRFPDAAAWDAVADEIGFLRNSSIRLTGNNMERLLYVSKEVQHFNLHDLTLLLKQARTANAAVDVTGVLLYHEGMFVQMLEGPPAAVESIMSRITLDRRHNGITYLASGHVAGARIFPDWRMGLFHMSAIEPLLQDGLVPNAAEEMTRLLAAADQTDVAASVLRTVWRHSSGKFLK